MIAANVCLISVAVRESLGGEFEEIWDVSRMKGDRPIAWHIFKDEDNTFDDEVRCDVDIIPHCLVMVDRDGIEVWFKEEEEENWGTIDLW